MTLTAPTEREPNRGQDPPDTDEARVWDLVHNLWDRMPIPLSRLIGPMAMVGFLGVCLWFYAFEVALAVGVLALVLRGQPRGVWLGAIWGALLASVVVVARGIMLELMGLDQTAIWGGAYVLALAALAGALAAQQRQGEREGIRRVVTPMDRIDDSCWAFLVLGCLVSAVALFGLAGAALGVAAVWVWFMPRFRWLGLATLGLIWFVCLINVTGPGATYASMWVTASREVGLEPAEVRDEAFWLSAATGPVDRFGTATWWADDVEMSEADFLALWTNRKETPQPIAQAESVVPTLLVHETLPGKSWGRQALAFTVKDGWVVDAESTAMRRHFVYDRARGVLSVRSQWLIGNESTPAE